MIQHAIRASAALLVAAGLGAATPAQAVEYPARKAGLWEQSLTQLDAGQQPAQVMQQCIDAASDKALREMGTGMSQKACTRNTLRQDGSRLVAESECKVGPSTVKGTTIITGDFQSSYRMEVNSSYSPPMMGRASSRSVIEGRWVGPCKPDQKPGDLILPGGQKMNPLSDAPPRAR